MDTFAFIKQFDLEQLIFFQEESVGLRAVVAVHNTVLGPAIGGVRMIDYPSQEALLHDAVDLAREMALRAALADCDLGGASAVLWGPQESKNEAFFRAFGRFLNRLGGQFYAVMEVGTDSRDLRNIKRETDYVLALPEAYGGIAESTEMTAMGLLQGIRAAAKFAFGSASLNHRTCLVQGVGRLGSAVVRLLHEAGAKIIVSDKNYDRIKNIQDKIPEITMVRPNEILDTKTDILIPCALGNLVTTENAANLRCRVIAGGASNILPDVETGDRLEERGIIYVPHFIVDAGELMQADFERQHRTRALLRAAIDEIYRRTLDLLEQAAEEKLTPLRTALKLAGQRLENVANIGRRRLV